MLDDAAPVQHAVAGAVSAQTAKHQIVHSWRHQTASSTAKVHLSSEPERTITVIHVAQTLIFDMRFSMIFEITQCCACDLHDSQ